MPKQIKEDNVLYNIKATKEFTDREEPRKVFWDKYTKKLDNMNKDNSIQVISYYGYGGIGKSSLLNKLREELKEKAPSSKYEFLDFKKLSELNNNILDILKYIKEDLKSKYDFSFPIFDLVCFVYETKLGKTATKPELNSILTENKDLNFLIEICNEIPVIGTFTKIISYADKGKNLLKERFQNERIRKRLLNIDDTPIENIKENLAYYFSLDLKENLKKEKAPFVFFIDTYEKLVNELNHVGNALNNDLWLRSDEGLICRVPNVIWVIAGREKLKWEEMDSSWKGSLEQHILGNLSFEDTSHFFYTAGIKNKELIDKLYTLTKGTPMYLDLCVDTFVKIKETGRTPQIEDFGEDTTKLVERFFMYMNNTERDFCIMLAYVPEWTDYTIENISKKMIGTFSISLYEKVRDFSFIVNENGRYRVHEAIRDIIFANTSKLVKEKYIRIMQEEANIEFEQIDHEDKENVEEKAIEKKQENENKIEKTVTQKNNDKKIIDIDNYEPRRKYILLINKLIADLMDSNNIEDFSQKAKYIIEKINEFELRYYVWFDYNYLEPIVEKFKDYNETAEYVLIKIKFIINKYASIKDKNKERTTAELSGEISEEMKTAHFAWQAYEKLREIYGSGDIRIIYPILEFIRKYEPYQYMDKSITEDFIKIVNIEIGKNNLYYLKLLGHRISFENEKTIEEFYTRFNNYKPEKIDIMYLEVSCEANAHVLALNEFIKNKYKGKKSEKELSKIQENERIVELNKLINCLEENTHLINSYILKLFCRIVKQNNRSSKEITMFFNYIYSIKNIALETTDIKVVEDFSRVLMSFVYIDEIKEKLLIFLKEIYNRLSEFESNQTKEINKKIITITFFVEPQQGINTIEQKSKMFSKEFFEFYGNLFRDIGLYNRPQKYEKITEKQRRLFFDVFEKNIYRIIKEAEKRNIKIDNKEFIHGLCFLLYSYLKTKNVEYYIKRIIDLSFEADKVCIWADDFIPMIKSACTEIYDKGKETSKVCYLSALEKLAYNILERRENASGKYFFENREKEKENIEISTIKEYLISLLLKEKVKEIEEQIKQGNLIYRKIYKNKNDKSLIKLIEKLYKKLDKEEENQNIFLKSERKKETIFKDYKILTNIEIIMIGIDKNSHNLNNFYNYYFNYIRAKEKRTKSLKENKFIGTENIENSKKFEEFFDDNINKKIFKFYKPYNYIFEQQKEISKLAKDIYGEKSQETIREYSYVAILKTIFDEEGSLELIENLIEISKTKEETNIELTKYLEHIKKCTEFILENSQIAYENFRLLKEEEINQIFLTE